MCLTRRIINWLYNVETRIIESIDGIVRFFLDPDMFVTNTGEFKMSNRRNLDFNGNRSKINANRSNRKFTHFEPLEPDYWSAPEPKVLKNHDLAPANHIVYFEQLVKAKIDTLMSKYPSIEWLCYLLGERDGDVTTVTDIVIPEQTVTSVRVDKIELENMGALPIVGVMHSHHGMGNGFSGTDDTYINANHKLSLCISHGGINGQFKWDTPEGDVVILKTQVRIKYPFEFDVDAFVKECNDKINEISYIYVYPQRYGYGYGARRTTIGVTGEAKKVIDDLGLDEDDLDYLVEECGYESRQKLIDDLNKSTREDVVNLTEPIFGGDYNSLGAEQARIGMDDVPPEGFGVEEWEVEDDFTLSAREAKALGLVKCGDCSDFVDIKECYRDVDPTGITNKECVLCKDCYDEYVKLYTAPDWELDLSVCDDCGVHIKTQYDGIDPSGETNKQMILCKECYVDRKFGKKKESDNDRITCIKCGTTRCREFMEKVDGEYYCYFCYLEEVKSWEVSNPPETIDCEYCGNPIKKIDAVVTESGFTCVNCYITSKTA